MNETQMWMKSWVSFQLWCFGCLASQENVDFFFYPVLVIRGISIADFLVPESKSVEMSK